RARREGAARRVVQCRAARVSRTPRPMSTERQIQHHEAATLPVVGHRIADAIVRDGARRVPVYDPARGTPTAEVVLGDAAIVDRAVAAAREAFPAWRETAPLKRARVL